jgi:hypothetical protein
MRSRKYAQNVFIGAIAVAFAGAKFVPGSDQPGPVLTAATAIVTGTPVASTTAPDPEPTAVASLTKGALTALSGSVKHLSRPEALEDAFHAYFAFKTEHADEVKKPYLYFVDYGLPSTEPRGYVFDMSTLSVIDGPFTVAHGRGSAKAGSTIPTRFSNQSSSNATSLGLYVTKALYDFHGHSGGHAYSSVGVRLDGVSTGFNDNAYARGVVAHGAPYVTPSRAGRSEGCPAMEPTRAKELLPKLANGAMVFLFAPDTKWLSNDPWLDTDAG